MMGGDSALGGYVLAKRQKMPSEHETEREKKIPPAHITLPDDNFFRPQMVDSTYQHAYVHRASPQNSPSGDMLTFVIERLNEGLCTFLSEMILSLRVRLVDKNGNPPSDESNVSVIPGFPTTMWKNVTLELNSKNVTGDDSGGWPLRTHVSHMVNVAPSGRKRDFMYGCQKMGESGYVSNVSTEYLTLQSHLLDRYYGTNVQGRLVDLSDDEEEEEEGGGEGGGEEVQGAPQSEERSLSNCCLMSCPPWTSWNGGSITRLSSPF